MKKITTLKTVFLLAGAVLFMSNRGGAPSGRTGSGVDGGKTCSTQSGCHGNASSTTESQEMLSSDIPASGYVPGRDYKVTLAANKSGTDVWGFQMMAEDGSAAAVGEFANNDDGNIVGSDKTRITHKFARTSSADGQTWVLDWTAPAPGTGDVKIFACVLGANGNGNTGGDKSYIDTLTISEGEVSSISQIDNSSIKLYPNPVVNELHIEGFSNNSASVSVFNVEGKEVLSSKFNKTISIEHLISGQYFLKINEGATSITKRFVKK